MSLGRYVATPRGVPKTFDGLFGIYRSGFSLNDGGLGPFRSPTQETVLKSAGCELQVCLSSPVPALCDDDVTGFLRFHFPPT